MIAKEIRALLPAWAACAAALLASAGGVYPLQYFGLPIYFIGLAGLGAFSIGHEYSYGTLDMVLTMPVRRVRIWTAKLGVLLAMVATLVVIALWAVRVDRGDRALGTALFWLPAIAAFFIAPWLTMVTRSPLAGAVFTIGIFGGSLVAGEWIGVARYGFTRNVDAFRFAFVWWTVGGLSLAGAVMGWRTFARLEVSGERGRDVQIALTRRNAASAATVRRRHPLAALVLKELRLQQLAFVVAGIYAAQCFAVGMAASPRSDLYSIVLVLTVFYMIAIPTVIGSLAGAEERQYGTHEAQLLVPMRASSQWIVKALTSTVLSVALALLLPLALSLLFQRNLMVAFSPRGVVLPQVLILVLGCVTIGLYVSTLARSGLSAMLYSIGAIFGVAYFVMRTAPWFDKIAFSLIHRWRPGRVPFERLTSDVFWIAPLIAFVVLVLWLALPNYRYANRSARRVTIHAAVVAACIATYASLLGVIEALTA